MGNKNKKFYIYFIIAFLPWAIIRDIFREKDIILGGIPSMLILFGLAWLIKLTFNFFSKKNKKHSDA